MFTIVYSINSFVYQQLVVVKFVPGPVSPLRQKHILFNFYDFTDQHVLLLSI